MKRILLALVLILALAGAAGAAQGGRPEHYTGLVQDEKGQPVAGATVDFYSYVSSEGFGYRQGAPELIGNGVTDSQGTFAVPSAPGATLVVVRKPGLATVWKTWFPIFANRGDPVVLSEPTSLSGVVLDESNQPVSGATVWVVNAVIGNEKDWAERENELFGKPARECFSARTSADGRFRIENFPADGHADLAVSKAGKAQRHLGGSFEPLRPASSGDDDIELRVGPSGAVEGRVVVTEIGEPLGGVKVRLEPSDSGMFGSDYRETMVSGEDGVFRVPDVQPGSYRIVPSIPGGPVPDWVLVEDYSNLTVVAGETARDVTVHLTKGALVQVSVVMTNEARPLAGVAVSAGGTIAYTGINGMAMFRVPVGETSFSARQDWYSQRRTAKVEAGRVNYVRIELIPPPTISGTVRDPSGAPIAGALVSFHPGFYPAAPEYNEVTTDVKGRYEITLRIGIESVLWAGPISLTNCILARELARNLAAIQEFEKIPASLDLDLQPGITLSGSVKDTESAPVTNATVALIFSLGTSLAEWAPRPAKVNAQGAFSFPAVPQGHAYCIEHVTAKGYGIYDALLMAEVAKTNHYEFPPFVVKRADRKLAGQVMGNDGKPVVGASVSFEGQGREWSNIRSGAEGRFVFNGVREGPVNVRAVVINSKGYSEGHIAAEGGDTNVVVRLGIK